MNDMTEKLIKLCKENPGLPIKTLVRSEVVGDDYGLWLGNVQDVWVGEIAIEADKDYNRYYTDNEKEEYKEDYYENHCEEIADRFEVNGVMDLGMVGKYLDEIACKAFKKSIIVLIS